MKIYFTDGVYYQTKKEAMDRAKYNQKQGEPEGFIEEITVYKLTKDVLVAVANSRGWANETQTIYQWNNFNSEIISSMLQ